METTRARALIDLSALRHNLAQVRQRAPGCQVLSVVKANAYGHGMVPVAKALQDSDGYGVATFEEGVTLRAAGIEKPILLLEGVLNTEQLTESSRLQLQVVVHQGWQADLVLKTGLPLPLVIWLKVDTGMHRLGLSPSDVPDQWQRLKRSPNVRELRLMSHFACADEDSHPLTDEQGARFASLQQRCSADQSSFANSAAILTAPQQHYQWVRPGLMLYGASPLPDTAESLNLKPVMHLQASIISLRTIRAGDSVGYGAIWRALRDSRIAIVSIGYGDGYPRHINSKAEVVIEGRRCPVVGRVSMDMLAVDVTAVEEAELHSVVTLWGPELPVEEVAAWAGTLNYELFCQVTPRIPRIYLQEAD